MRGMQVGMMVAAASLLGGCAGGVTRTDVSRLQSQVGLLDERVTQLEHAASAGPAPVSAAPAIEPALSPEPAPATSEHRRRGKRAAAATITAAVQAPASSALKPTTREIQQALKNAGFYQGAIDGKTGPMTHNAVEEFQRVHGLTDDGVVGKQTWEKLSSFADLSGKSGEANAAEVLK